MESIKPLTGLMISDDESFLVICPELSLFAQGENMLDAKENLYKLLFDYYFCLSFNRVNLNDDVYKSYEIFQKQIFPWSQKKGMFGGIFSSSDSGGGLMGFIRKKEEKVEFNWEDVIDFRIL